MPRKQGKKDRWKSSPISNAEHKRGDPELPDVKRLFALAARGLIEVPGAMQCDARGALAWLRAWIQSVAARRVIIAP